MNKKFFENSPKTVQRSLSYSCDARRAETGVENLGKASGQVPTLTAFDIARCSSAEARLLVPFEHAVRMKILPIGAVSMLGKTVFSVVTHSCLDHDSLKALRFIVQSEIRQSIVPDEALLLEAIHLAYKGGDDRLTREVDKLNRKSHFLPRPQAHASPDLLETKGSEIAEFLATLLEYASVRRASDIHLFPTLTGTQIKLRIGGVLYNHNESVCTLLQHEELIRRIKVLASLDTTSTKLPQEGSMSFLLAKERVYVRVSTMPTIHGEKVAFRFTGSLSLRCIRDLGYSERSVDFFEEAISAREGAVIVCGPTGSGKSTSLYAVLGELRNRNLQIVSIEDPVEIQLSGISQSSVSEKEGFTYARALKAVLRQDPDVICVGECRDAQTAQSALQAALTGHLVLTTFHAKGVRECLTRLSEFGIEGSIIRQSLSLIVFQRLLPRLCQSCKIFDLSLSRSLGFDAHRPVGCAKCEYSGFSGQIVVEEALRVTTDSLKYIQTETSSAESQCALYVSFRERHKELIQSGQLAGRSYMDFS